MSKKAKQNKAIKELLTSFSGIETEFYGNGIRKTVQLEISSHEDITNYISSLLEVCYYALDGNGVFVSQANKDSLPSSSVTKVIELIMDLLPHNQMHCMDRMTALFEDLDNRGKDSQ